jgi:diguanylate cyclase (GGDEF)-like protein
MLLGSFALVNTIVLAVSFVVIRNEWKRGGGYVEKLQATTHEMSLLASMSSGLQSCASVAEGKDLMQHFLERLFPQQSGGLYVIRASRNILEVKAAWGDAAGWSPLMESQDCWALRLGHVHEFVEGGNSLPCRHVREAGGGYFCVPMMAEGEALGLLHLRRPATAPVAGDDLAARAERIATQLGPVIASLTLREQFRQQSIRDGLTGLYNRRYLEETMGRELLRARRTGSALAVIMADVDHFKKLNDTHGHQAGDDVLQTFSVYLKDAVRGDDIACRYGGEEFSVILPGAGLEMAMQRAEALRAGLANLRVRIGRDTLPPITASFGVAIFPEHGETWEALLRAADGALYAAKRAGRDRVASASAETVN